ncbi:protein NRT1/ PTR FAMILY 5.6-like [Cornus florida]|uniref:protein NRT1/ PTR FAMILY 5.6-like n=1 Tax=Cornus florida TaxID=4283 RepID=UPI00289C5127|nr:protein NRT1/ PTR FAMILY 5.6-like [Cornus florida]
MEQEIKKRNDGDETSEHDDEKWVFDSSLDHKGRVPLRASTGVWKASLLIITIEFSERLAYFGIATNLITYLTGVMKQDLKTAAKNVNYWSGVTTVLPLVGGFIADAYTGRFSLILLSSIIYLMGLSFLTISEFIPSLKPCDTEVCSHPRKVHEVVFFSAMYFISLGTGGHKPCLESFGADQFDDDHLEERKQKMSFFNWWNFALCCGLLLGVTLIVYVEDSASWGVADLILTVTMAISVIIFYSGKPFYRYRVPEGSPLTPMLQVLVAAMTKRNLTYPSSPALLHEAQKSEKSQGRFLCHTNNFKFLDKAAIIEDDENSSVKKKQSPRRLATVTRVEELKLVLNMIPIWLTSLTFGVCVAQASTFFIKQSSTMNRKIGNNFEIPPASVYSLAAIGMIFSVTVYEKILVPILRRATGNERGIEILQRIGIGMIFPVASMATAALVESKRLRITNKESMSVFWLAPQFIILGIGDGFTLVGLQEYFYDQVPDSMRSLGIAFYLSVIGVGNFLSSFLITIVDHITEKGGTSWFGKDLNRSRLDYFYWLLAAMNGLNLCIYVLLARKYTYKNVQKSVVMTDFYVGDRTGSMA